MSRWWPLLRRLWAIAGSLALVGWVTWCAIAFQPNAYARSALSDTAQVHVRALADGWLFEPIGRAADARSLVFFPGGLVDARAYAPLMQSVARGGHRALLVRTPWRGAFGHARAGPRDHADAGRPLGRRRAFPRRQGRRRVRAAIPRCDRCTGAGRHDVSLRDAPFAVVQVLGDRDPIASVTRADRNRHHLPEGATRHVLRGANHSQFGDYGFQPGDRFARMPRDAQRAATAAALHAALAGRPTSISTTDGRR